MRRYAFCGTCFVVWKGGREEMRREEKYWTSQKCLMHGLGGK